MSSYHVIIYVKREKERAAITKVYIMPNLYGVNEKRRSLVVSYLLLILSPKSFLYISCLFQSSLAKVKLVTYFVPSCRVDKTECQK